MHGPVAAGCGATAGTSIVDECRQDVLSSCSMFAYVSRRVISVGTMLHVLLGCATAGNADRNPSDGQLNTTLADAAENGTNCQEDATQPCNNDNQCPSNAYCDASHCAKCSFICFPVCVAYSASCSGSVQLQGFTPGDTCTVLVRVTQSDSTIQGYAVNCGVAQPVSVDDLKNSLTQSSSLDWSAAESISDASATGVFAFKLDYGTVPYAAYFSAITGRLLYVAQPENGDAGAGTVPISINWRPASELGSACVSEIGMPVTSFGISASDTGLASANESLSASGVYRGIRANVSRVSYASVTEISEPESVYLFFITGG